MFPVSVFLAIQCKFLDASGAAPICKSPNDPLCVADKADQGAILLASHFELDRLQVKTTTSDQYQSEGLMLRRRSWIKNHKKLKEAADMEQDVLTEFIEAQKESGDMCSSRLLEAKRSLDGLLHDLKSLSTQVEDHMTVLEVEEQNLDATQLSIDAVHDAHREETTKCNSEREKALEDLAQYSAELEELKQIAKPSVRYEHVVTVEGMPEAPNEATPALLQEGEWNMKSCEAFVAYAKKHKDLKFMSLMQEPSKPNARAPAFEILDLAQGGSNTNSTAPRFKDVGAGCCAGKVDQSRPALMSQSSWRGLKDDLQACKQHCRKLGPLKCGFIEYGWSRPEPKWCVVHPPETECKDTKAGPKDCGAGGGDGGVHAYKFLQAPEPEPESKPETGGPDPEPFNCLTRETWSPEKKEWCCKNKNLGCPKVKSKFTDLGAGCCSGGAGQSRSALMSQTSFKGFQPNLKACKHQCKKVGPEKCGFIEYGWNHPKGRWCVVHPPGTECSNTKAGPKDCGSGGGDNGVHAYAFLPVTTATTEPEMGGPDPESKEPEYNCLTKESWSPEKKEWCCKNKNLGCPTPEIKPVEIKPIVGETVAITQPPTEKHVDDFGDISDGAGVESGEGGISTGSGSSTDETDGAVDERTFNPEKPKSPIELNCNQQRNKLQRIFTKAYNAVKDLKKDAKERSEDKICQKTADAKKASLLVPLVAQRDQAVGRIEYSEAALAALEPVLKQVENRVERLRKYINSKLTPECKEASEVSKYLQDVRDLIISLQKCPGRDDFTLKIPSGRKSSNKGKDGPRRRKMLE